MAELLSGWTGERPEMTVKLETPRTYRDGLDAVEEQALDLCFSVLPGSAGAAAYPLLEDPYYLVVAADHPLAGRERVLLKDVLGKVPLLPNGESFDPDGPLWAVFRRTEHVLLADSAPMEYPFSLALAEKGLGAALLPGLALEELMPRDTVRCIPLADGLHRTVTLLCAQEEDRSPLVAGLLPSILRLWGREEGGASA